MHGGRAGKVGKGFVSECDKAVEIFAPKYNVAP